MLCDAAARNGAFDGNSPQRCWKQRDPVRQITPHLPLGISDFVPLLAKFVCWSLLHNIALAQPGGAVLLSTRVSTSDPPGRSRRQVRPPDRGTVPRPRRARRAGPGRAADHPALVAAAPDRRPVCLARRARPRRPASGQRRRNPLRQVGAAPAQSAKKPRLAGAADAGGRRQRLPVATSSGRSGNGGPARRGPAGGPPPAPALPDAGCRPPAGTAPPAAPKTARAAGRPLPGLDRGTGPPARATPRAAAPLASFRRRMGAAQPPLRLAPAASGMRTANLRTPASFRRTNIIARSPAAHARSHGVKPLCAGSRHSGESRNPGPPHGIPASPWTRALAELPRSCVAVPAPRHYSAAALKPPA